MIALFLMSLLPQPCVVDTCDIAELNHVWCPSNGIELGVYWVWWRWQGEAYHVFDWRVMKEVPMPTQGIQEWYDKRTKTNRRVESKVFRETFTWYDVETFDRQYWPDARRRKLRAK